jgi:hypothetical protein
MGYGAIHCQRSEENAAFIVRACNAYDDMLAALEELVEEADDHPGWEGHKYGNTLGFQWARAAIRKAKGE